MGRGTIRRTAGATIVMAGLMTVLIATGTVRPSGAAVACRWDRHEIAYIPTVHPELSGPGSLVISYDIDSTAGISALRRDVHQYQPQFLQPSWPDPHVKDSGRWIHH
jgi:hypothetical protein